MPVYVVVFVYMVIDCFLGGLALLVQAPAKKPEEWVAKDPQGIVGSPKHLFSPVPRAFFQGFSRFFTVGTFVFAIFKALLTVKSR